MSKHRELSAEADTEAKSQPEPASVEKAKSGGLNGKEFPWQQYTYGGPLLEIVWLTSLTVEKNTGGNQGASMDSQSLSVPKSPAFPPKPKPAQPPKRKITQPQTEQRHTQTQRQKASSSAAAQKGIASSSSEDAFKFMQSLRFRGNLPTIHTLRAANHDQTPRLQQSNAPKSPKTPDRELVERWAERENETKERPQHRPTKVRFREDIDASVFEPSRHDSVPFDEAQAEQERKGAAASVAGKKRGREPPLMEIQPLAHSEDDREPEQRPRKFSRLDQPSKVPAYRLYVHPHPPQPHSPASHSSSHSTSTDEHETATVRGVDIDDECESQRRSQLEAEPEPEAEAEETDELQAAMVDYAALFKFS